MRTYDDIWKIATAQGDGNTTSCPLDYYYFKEHYKLIAIHFSKQQALDADPKAIQHIILLGMYIQIEIQQHFSLSKT